MFFLKQTLTILLIVAFTQAVSQELNNEKFYSNDKTNTNSQISDIANTNIEEGKGLTNPYSDQQIEKDLLAMASERIKQNNEDGAPIEFLAPVVDAKFKRGRMIDIKWTGGDPEQDYALDVFDGKFHYRHVAELKNSGSYPWIIPSDVKPGKEYKFKLTNTDDFGESAFSKTFIIKRKVPIAAWIIPGAIVVGGAVFLLFYDNSDPVLSDLPIPIDPE